ncbi:MAG: hypothetical protein ABJG47_00375 [Ekhidna sp.]
MRKIIITFFLTLAFSFCLAQNDKEFDNLPSGVNVNFQKNPIRKDIEGNPYYFEDWRKGIIRYSKDSYKIDTHEMNINLLTSEVIFNRHNKTYVVSNKENIKQVEFEEDTFKLVELKSKLYFSRVAYNGKYSVLELVTSKFVEGTPAKGYTPATKDRYERKSRFYIQFPDESLQEINPGNGKKIFKLLDAKTAELKQYVDDNKIKLNELSSLIKAMEYYNSLI